MAVTLHISFIRHRSLLNAEGMAQYLHGNSCTSYSDKEKAYVVTTKLQVVEVTEKVSKEAAARQFGVDPQRSHEW